MLTLSVVVPSHSRDDLLAVCLRGVTRHAPPGTEIIVVDDGSAGGRVSIAASSFPGVTVLRSERPGGFAAAANRGLFAASGDIVELLNDDAEVTAGWADAPLKAFERNGKIAAVAPLVLIADSDPPRIDSAGDDYDRGGFARKRSHRGLLSEATLRAEYVTAASGSSAFYRRGAVCDLGGFAEDFEAYFEDVDLSLRLGRAGWRVWFEPASVVRHRVGSTHGKPAGRLLRQQSRNEERLFWRNLPRRRRVSALARHAAVLAGKSLRRLREGTWLDFARGRLRAWAELTTKESPTRV